MIFSELAHSANFSGSDSSANDANLLAKSFTTTTGFKPTFDLMWASGSNLMKL